MGGGVTVCSAASFSMVTPVLVWVSPVGSGVAIVPVTVNLLSACSRLTAQTCAQVFVS